MSIYQEIKKSFRSLLMHRLRSLLSTLGILFGVVSIITMLSIGEGAKQETLAQIEQLGMNSILIRQQMLSEEQYAQAAEKKSQGLSWQDVEALHHNIPYLMRIAPLKVIAATTSSFYSASLSPEILAVTRAFGEMKQLQLSEGRFLCDLDQEGKRRVCVLGHAVAKEIGKEGHIGCSLRLGKIDYEVVGILKSTNWKASQHQLMTLRNLDKAIFIPLGTEFTLSPFNTKNHLSEVLLQIQNVQQVEVSASLAQRVLQKLHGNYEDYQVVIPQELLRQANRTQRTFNWVLGSIAGISLLVGGIGIMNIMLATVLERRREIGIRRAVGASQKHILCQFLLETLLLTLIGAILGLFFGIGFSIVISLVAGWKTIVTLWSIVLALVMSSGVGICSGLYPAYQAAMMDPIKALTR